MFGGSQLVFWFFLQNWLCLAQHNKDVLCHSEFFFFFTSMFGSQYGYDDIRVLMIFVYVKMKYLWHFNTYGCILGDPLLGRAK